MMPISPSETDISISGKVNSGLSWMKLKTKPSFDIPRFAVLSLIPVIVLCILLFVGHYFIGTSFSKVDKTYPLKNAKLVTPENVMVRCAHQKPIFCLEVKDGFYQNNDKLYSKVQLSSALKEGNHLHGQKLVQRPDYSSEVKLINALHTHLFQTRLANDLSLKRQRQTISEYEVQGSGWGEEISKIISHSSFLSIKRITFTDEGLIKGGSQFSIQSALERSLIDPTVAIATISLDKGERRENIFTLEPCTRHHCFHQHSEILIMPMELTPKGDDVDPFQGQGQRGWWSLLSWFGKKCKTFPSTRCTLSIRQVPWTAWMQFCGVSQNHVCMDGKGGVKGKEPHPSNCYFSILMCH